MIRNIQLPTSMYVAMYATTFTFLMQDYQSYLLYVSVTVPRYLLLSNLAKFIGKLDTRLTFLLKLKIYKRYRYYLRSQGRRGVR